MESSNDELRAQYIGTNPKRDFPIVSLILSSTVFNGIIFFLLPSKIAPLTKSYIVSTIHAIVAVLSVSFYCARSTINLRQVNRIIGGGIAGTYDELMPYSLCYSCGYFLYDLLIMLMYKSVRSGSALIHHITIFSGIIVGIYTGIGHSCHFYLLGEELSTIPLNLKTMYTNNARLYNLFTNLFILTFFVVRLVYGSVISYYTFAAVPSFISMAYRLSDYFSITTVVFECSLGIVTRLLNIYWAILISRKAYAKLRKRK